MLVPPASSRPFSSKTLRQSDREECTAWCLDRQTDRWTDGQTFCVCGKTDELQAGELQMRDINLALKQVFKVALLLLMKYMLAYCSVLLFLLL